MILGVASWTATECSIYTRMQTNVQITNVLFLVLFHFVKDYLWLLIDQKIFTFLLH